jgi:hypothetical protein
MFGFGKKKAPPATRIAAAYRFSDAFVLHSQGRAPSWIHIACEPYKRLSRTASADDLGRAVRSVLHAYRPEVPEPADFKQVTADFVRGMGVKSNKRLQETSIYCGLRQKEDGIEFAPNHNGGTAGDTKGFQPIEGATFVIPAEASDGEFGAALLRGFDLCTSIFSTT